MTRTRTRGTQLRRAAVEAPAGASESDPGPSTGPTDDDAPAPVSATAAAANASGEAAVKTASIHSVELAAPTAPNQYLPIPAGFSLPLPPDPVRFPRAPVNIKLAVCLLRSTYETVDAMDIMPMDTFQIRFWKSRQAEWEPYTFQAWRGRGRRDATSRTRK